MRLLSSLTNRIFLASSLLAVLSIAVAVYVVNAAVTAQAEAELQRGLEEADGLLEEYRALVVQNLTRQARLIADLPRFKAAVSLDDAPTMAPVAEEYRQQIDSDLLIVTNGSGRILAQVGNVEVPAGDSRLRRTIETVLEHREISTFWPSASGVLQVVSVPVWIEPRRPEVLGTLNVGFRLDRPLAERFKALTESEVVFAAGGDVQAATLPLAHHAAVADLAPSSRIRTIALGGDEYVAVSRSLLPAPLAGSEESLVEGLVPTVTILRSRTERLRFLRQLHTALGLTALVAILAATLVSYGVARTVTRPLRAVTAAMREVAATGDVGRPVVVPRAHPWDDEDARLLARAFDTMTQSVGRFQREAAQRERLSSLGRLSTVIAHEIRNPLMIIKASLRTLRTPSPDPARLRDAVSDIDEEVARLNRLVSEVLDFARPIRFDISPADLAAVCRDAVAAVSSGNERVGIRLELDEGIPQLATDSERLRLALINILTNAWQAVGERHDPDRAPARPPGGAEPIVLRASRLEGDRVRLEVQDQGPGIPLHELPRVFEPYFTTRKTGSGLGLAIAKNIIEGLGGSIAAESGSEGGTCVRIELPVAARPDRGAPAITPA